MRVCSWTVTVSINMIEILCIGKIKDKNLNNLIDDYISKISHYHSVSIKELNAVKNGEINKIIEEESNELLSKINDKDYVFLLDLHGKSIDSIKLAKQLDNCLCYYNKIVFVIGGSYGLSDKLRKRANLSIKLSDLTFLHTFTRVIILEQIYRCFKINNNEDYHK